MATITANGSKGHHKFTLEVTESSYSVANNTSDVAYTLKISPIQSGWDWNASGVSYKININGSQVASGPIYTYNGSSTVTIKSGTTTGILHENNGSKTIDIGFTITDTTGYNYTPGNASKTGTLTLTTIPRASQISVTDANIGSSTNITINKASNDFTTTIYYKAQGQNSWTKIVDKTANQVYPWTVPTSFYSIIPSAITMTCQFYADTYNGNTLVGTSSTVTATFTATGNPTISSIVAKDINATTIALTGNDDTMVKYASNVRVTVTASGQNSATISSIKINNVVATGGVVTFNGATTNTYQVVVTDSRGYTTSQTKTMIGANYIPLTINQTIVRNQPTDNKINITASGNYYPGTFGATLNSLTVEYRYKERSSSTWGSWTNLSVTVSGNTYSGNTQLSNMNYTKIYDFEIRAKDKVYPNGEKTITGITVSKGKPIFNWDDDKFNVNGTIKQNGSNVALASSIGNATLTIQKNGSTVKNFTANASSDVTANITVPTNTNQLTNGAGFITSSSLPSATTGSVTCTKSSGNSTINTATYYQYGKVITIFIKLKTSGNTSIGSNIWSGKISNVTLPKTRVTGAGYYASGIAMAGIYGTSEGSDSGRMDIRALGASFANNQEIHFSITYVTNN